MRQQIFEPTKKTIFCMSALTEALIESKTGRPREQAAAAPAEIAAEASSRLNLTGRPPRPAWIEIDLGQLRRNFQLINQDKPPAVRLLSVVKDEAYGHGALQTARVALDCGADFLALATVEEAMALRARGIQARVLLLGDRQETELSWCVAHDLTCCVSEPQITSQLARLAARAGKRVPVHVKINTGMNRYGVRWSEAAPLIAHILATKSLELEGVLSHFA